MKNTSLLKSGRTLHCCKFGVLVFLFFSFFVFPIHVCFGAKYYLKECFEGDIHENLIGGVFSRGFIDRLQPEFSHERSYKDALTCIEVFMSGKLDHKYSGRQKEQLKRDKDKVVEKLMENAGVRGAIVRPRIRKLLTANNGPLDFEGKLKKLGKWVNRLSNNLETVKKDTNLNDPVKRRRLESQALSTMQTIDFLQRIAVEIVDLKVQYDKAPESKSLDIVKSIKKSKKAFKAVLEYAKAGDKLVLTKGKSGKDDLIESLEDYRKHTQSLFNDLTDQLDAAGSELVKAGIDKEEIERENHELSEMLRNIVDKADLAAASYAETQKPADEGTVKENDSKSPITEDRNAEKNTDSGTLKTADGVIEKGPVSGTTKKANNETIKEPSQSYRKGKGEGSYKKMTFLQKIIHDIVIKTINKHRKSSRTLTATTIKPNVQIAKKAVNTYGSLPGGVTLEGNGQGLENVRTVGYQTKRKVIVINGSLEYELSISPGNMKAILKAIAKKDEMGVSLGGGKYTVYGGLEKYSEIDLSMQMVDWFFAAVTYDWYKTRENIDWFRDYRIAKGFKPRIELYSSTKGLSYYNFKDYRFAQEGHKYKLVSSILVMTIIPQSGKKAKDGGAILDYEAIKKGLISELILENIKHISDNFDYYPREPIIQEVDAFGETAAFARGLKRNGVDLAKLASTM